MTWLEKSLALFENPISCDDFEPWERDRNQVTRKFLGGEIGSDQFANQAPSTPDMLSLPYPGPLYGLVVRTIETKSGMTLDKDSRALIRESVYHEREHFREAMQQGNYVDTRVAYVRAPSGITIHLFTVNSISDDTCASREQTTRVMSAPSELSEGDEAQLPASFR